MHFAKWVWEKSIAWLLQFLSLFPKPQFLSGELTPNSVSFPSSFFIPLDTHPRQATYVSSRKVQTCDNALLTSRLSCLYIQWMIKEFRKFLYEYCLFFQASLLLKRSRKLALCCQLYQFFPQFLLFVKQKASWFYLRVASEGLKLRTIFVCLVLHKITFTRSICGTKTNKCKCFL